MFKSIWIYLKCFESFSTENFHQEFACLIFCLGDKFNPKCLETYITKFHLSKERKLAVTVPALAWWMRKTKSVLPILNSSLSFVRRERLSIALGFSLIDNTLPKDDLLICMTYWEHALCQCSRSGLQFTLIFLIR